MSKVSGSRPQTARRRALIPLLQEQGFVAVAEIAKRFNVSEMTIRRDIRGLEKNGDLERAHGGAVPLQNPPIGSEPSFVQRQRFNAGAKQTIATAAAAIVRPNEMIGIDVGSTALQFARSLPVASGIRVFTNALRVAMILAERGIPVYTPGGEVRPMEMSFTGGMALAQLQNYRMDRVFLGVAGLTKDGIFDYSLEDSEIKRMFIRQSSQAIVLADSSKFGNVSTVRITGLAKISIVVTESQPQPELRATLHAAGVQVIVANGNDS
jgi:DeoR/GlpR family transcriptional regulator of sugar metabolism